MKRPSASVLFAATSRRAIPASFVPATANAAFVATGKRARGPPATLGKLRQRTMKWSTDALLHPRRQQQQRCG